MILTDASADLVNRMVNDFLRRPSLPTATDPMHEALQYLLAFGGMGHLGMELETIEPLLFICHSRQGRTLGLGNDMECRWQYFDSVTMAHPNI